MTLCVLALACTQREGADEMSTAGNGTDRSDPMGAGSSSNPAADGAGNTRGTSDGTSGVARQSLPASNPKEAAAEPSAAAMDTAGNAADGASTGEAPSAPPAAIAADSPGTAVPKLPANGTLDEAADALEGALDGIAAGELGGIPATAEDGAGALPRAGNLGGGCAVPPEAAAVDTSSPDHVVGDGSPESCSADAFIAAVALGGTITFDCGPAPVVITLDRPAKVVNDAAPDVVIDGGGRVTLDGNGTTRILYMNTCDPEQHFTSTHCDNQDTPRLTLQNLTFMNGNSMGELEYTGGGAIWARGGQLKVVGSRFFNNRCVETGPDVGGAGIRVFSQYENRPVFLVDSTFGGAPGLGNTCANGGGISSINVSWSIYNSLFSHNRALGNGGNPAEEGTPGGGSGGGIYSDGMSNVLSVCGTRIEDNAVNAFGSGIFFVNNDHGGSLQLESTVIRNNAGGGWNVLPGVSMHEDTSFVLLDTLLE
jgi:hypothetical protein